MVATDTPSASLIWERAYPLLCGVVAGGAILFFWPGGYLFAEAKHWELNKLFDTGFDFSAVATSFLFTFYTFVVTAERGFISRMRLSLAFAMLIEYTVIALILGTALAASSLVLAVVGPKPAVNWDVATFLWAGWSFVAAWTLAAFFRTTILFIAFASADA
jgi:hypothetical protein